MLRPDIGYSGPAFDRAIYQMTLRLAGLAAPPRRYAEAGQYQIFRDPQERKDVFLASKGMADYVQAAEIDAVVFVDRAARPINTGLREYWRATHTSDDMPPVTYFIDPKGFRTDSRSSLKPEAAKRRFAEDHPYLASHKMGAILVMDTCMHSGGTLDPVRKTMRAAGFKNLKLGVVSNENNDTTRKLDFVALNYEPQFACDPFAVTPVVTYGNNGKLYVKAGIDGDIAEARGDATLARQEIRRIIREGVMTDGVR